MPKTLNIAGTSHSSWYGFMLRVAEAFSLDSNLVKPYRKESPGTTRSPRNGKLSSAKARRLGVPLYSYQQGIEKMLADDRK
jgi:dTDP-4-dehydrorhamnose reductase